MTSSRPDIMQDVGIVARFQYAPKEAHEQAVKRIFIYLKGTLDLTPWYPLNNELILEAYTNA